MMTAAECDRALRTGSEIWTHARWGSPTPCGSQRNEHLVGPENSCLRVSARGCRSTQLKIGSQRTKYYCSGGLTVMMISTLGEHSMKPDIVSDIDDDIGGCYTPILGYPILVPMLTPISGVILTTISGVNRYCV